MSLGGNGLLVGGVGGGWCVRVAVLFLTAAVPPFVAR